MVVRNSKTGVYLLVFLIALAALSAWIWYSFATPFWIRNLETEIFGNFASPSTLKACSGVVNAKYPNHAEYDYSTTIYFEVKQSGWEQGRGELSIDEPYLMNVIWSHPARYDQLTALAMKSGSLGQDIVATMGPDYQTEFIGKKWVDGDWTVVILRPIAGARVSQIHLMVTKGARSNVRWAVAVSSPTQPGDIPR